MNAPLAPYLTPEHLREVAGAAVYARAQQYVEEGRVRLRSGPNGTLQGEVDGSRAYTVALEAGPAGLLSTCDCPWARAHGLCKHGVALGLAFLAAGAAPTTGERPSADAHPRGPEATEAWVDLNQVGHARHLALRALLPHLGARTVDRLVFLLPQEASVVDAAAGRVAQSLGRLGGDVLERVEEAAWAVLQAEAARVREGLAREARLRPVTPTDVRLAPAVAALRSLRARLREDAVPRGPPTGGARVEALWTDSPPRLVVREGQHVLPRGGRARAPTPVEVTLRLAALLEGAPALACTCTPGGEPACVHALSAVDEALEALCDPERGPRLARLADALGAAPWARVLGALESVARGREDEAPAPAQHELTWRLGGLDSGHVRLEPYLHRARSARGPNGTGRRTAGTRVTSREEAAALACCAGPEAAREREALELRLLSQSAYGDHERRVVLRLLRLLAGSPRLVLEDRPDVSLALREVRLGLLFQPEAAAGGEPRVRVVPSLDGAPADPEALLRARERSPRGWPWTLFEPEAARVTLVDAPPGAPEVLEALRDWGARVPAAALEALVDRAPALERAFSLALPPALEGRRVELSPAQVVRLQPLGAGGLQVTLLAQPLAEARLQTPGQGAALLRGTRGAERVAVVRDLAGEAARAGALARELGLAGSTPGAAAGDAGDFTFTVHEPTRALELVEALQRLAGPLLRAEWPEEAWQVVAPPTAGALRVEVRKARDWFGVGGKLELEGGSLSLEDLLEAVRARAHFVPLGRGRFLRLTRQLREQLGVLADLSFPAARGGLQLSPAAAPALEALEAEGAEVKAPKDWRALSARIASASALDVPLPRGLKAELRPYQEEGFRWLVRLTEWGAGGCLADDMGLGKTVQALALLLHRAARGPQLVVAPTSVGFNWMREGARFAPSLRLLDFREERHGAFKGLGPGDVVVASYALLTREVKAFAGVQWATVVADEAQAVKNADTARAKALRALDAGARVALTGTPVENRLSELWSLFAFLFPGLLAGREAFRARFAIPIERDGDAHRRAALAALLRPFVLRRTKGEVARELPARTEVAVPVTLSPAERKVYDDARRLILARLGADAGAQDKRFEVLAALTHLRLLACHPRLGDPHSDVPSSKLERFMELVQELRAEGHRALVFSQFVRHLDLVREALDAAGVPYLYLDGSTPPKERQARVDAFQAGTGTLFLISLKAGGTGLNLTAANHVLHLDPWWNPAVEDQATDRTHRIGQDKPVTVLRLVSLGTIEEAIVGLHAEKRELAASLLSGADGAAALTPEQLLALLRFTGASREDAAAPPPARPLRTARLH